MIVIMMLMMMSTIAPTEVRFSNQSYPGYSLPIPRTQSRVIISPPYHNFLKYIFATDIHLHPFHCELPLISLLTYSLHTQSTINICLLSNYSQAVFPLCTPWMKSVNASWYYYFGTPSFIVPPSSKWSFYISHALYRS